MIRDLCIYINNNPITISNCEESFLPVQYHIGPFALFPISCTYYLNVVFY